MGNTQIAKTKKITPKPKKTAFSLSAQKFDNYIKINLPLVTVSESNKGGEHWSIKSNRHEKQKGIVHLILRRYAKFIPLPCTIKLIRYAPRKLDRHDNLTMSMKWICDAVCEMITGDFRAGMADNNPSIRIEYDQVSSPGYGVEVIISF